MGAIGVIFDVDGLLLDSEAIYRASWREAAIEQGVAIDDATYRTFVGSKISAAEERVAAMGEAFDLERFRAGWRARWDALADAGVAPKDGALALLDALARAGVPLAVATSSARPQARRSLGALWGRFAAVVTGDQVAHGKPAPDIYLAAARGLSVEPTACLALEDSDHGARAAINAGMPVVVVPDLVEPSDAVRAQALMVAGSLVEAAPVVMAWCARSRT